MGAVLAMILGALALAAWLSAVAHMLMLMPHRRDDVSIVSLFFNGFRFYVQDTWKPSGHAIHRRFLYSVGAFFAVVVLGMLVGVLTAAR